MAPYRADGVDLDGSANDRSGEGDGGGGESGEGDGRASSRVEDTAVEAGEAGVGRVDDAGGAGRDGGDRHSEEDEGILGWKISIE